MSLAQRNEYTEHCTRCSQCKWLPLPRSQRFAHVCPSIQYGNFHSYSAGGKAITGYALEKGAVSYSEEMLRSVYTCTMCGACDTACKFNLGDMVEPLDTLYALRERIATDGMSPPSMVREIENLERYGNIYGRPKEERSQWAEGLNIKNILNDAVDVFLYVGCDNAYDSTQWPALRRLANFLNAKNISFGIAYNEETSAGKEAFDYGYPALAEQLANHTVSLIRRANCKQVISVSSDMVSAFRNMFPRFKIDTSGIEFLHITEFLAEIDNRDVNSPADRVNRKITYHDPCKLGRLAEPHNQWNGKQVKVMNGIVITDPLRKAHFGLNGVYDAPRELLARLPNIELVEMERTREFSYCCGAGGGAAQAHPDFAEHAAKDRLEEALATGADTLVTSCAGCEKHLRDVAKRANLGIDVVNILDLVVEQENPGLATAESCGESE